MGPSTLASYDYDALNRITNCTAPGYFNWVTISYNSFGAVASEDGPWADDTVSYGYTTNHLRQSLTLTQPNAPPWLQTLSYDPGNRVQSLTSPAGTFNYGYRSSQLTATGRFDVALNMGLGLSSGLAVVDFNASFNEVLHLFDSNSDGRITVGELRVLHGDLATASTAYTSSVGPLYTSTALATDVVPLAQVVRMLNTDRPEARQQGRRGCGLKRELNRVLPDRVDEPGVVAGGWGWAQFSRRGNATSKTGLR
jgi:hypothetical protein